MGTADGDISGTRCHCVEVHGQTEVVVQQSGAVLPQHHGASHQVTEGRHRVDNSGSGVVHVDAGCVEVSTVVVVGVVVVLL